MTSTQVLRVATTAGMVAALALCGCGGDAAQPRPADRVREATRRYLGALEAGDWPRSCRLLAASARRELESAAGARCARALAAGAALSPDQAAGARREVAGARVRIRGAAATIGPFDGLPRPLELRRVGARWLISG